MDESPLSKTNAVNVCMINSCHEETVGLLYADDQPVGWYCEFHTREIITRAQRQQRIAALN